MTLQSLTGAEDLVEEGGDEECGESDHDYEEDWVDHETGFFNHRLEASRGLRLRLSLVNRIIIGSYRKTKACSRLGADRPASSSPHSGV